MASVIAQLQASSPPDIEQTSIATMNINRRLWSIDRMAPAIAALLKLRGREPNTILHVHLGPAGSTVREGFFAILGSRLGFRVVTTVHSSRLATDLQRPGRSRVIRTVLRSSTMVRTLGPAAEELIRPLLGEDTDLVTIPNGIELVDRPGPPPDSGIVLFAGEVGPRKGVDVLLEGWPAVRRALPRSRLLLIGPLAEGFECPETEGVEFLGPVEPSEVRDHIDQADLCVLPSLAEAFPMFLLEAMGGARPVVSTPVGDIPTMLEGFDLLVPPGDAEALAAKLEELLQMEESATRELGDRLRARVEERYSAVGVGAELAEHYRRLARPG
ncbi:MAG: glycosyltransferase family 4 protein [Actinomycetia bacterium]|nr:glycosyltransferase family 4 protein [Actinomycetes bacterium]